MLGRTLRQLCERGARLPAVPQDGLAGSAVKLDCRACSD
jgi:hypothetical protein